MMAYENKEIDNHLAAVFGEDPTSGKQVWTYNLNRQVETYTNRRGESTTYEYDEGGRLIAEHRSDNEITYSYDESGNLISAGDNDSKIDMGYSAYGQLENVETGGTKISIDYDRDKLGRVVNREVSVGKTDFSTTYGYDSLGQLTDIDGDYGFGYDLLGRLVGIDMPYGHLRAYSYDKIGRLLEVDNFVGGVPVSNSAYTYDKAGNRTSIADDWGNRVFGYDVLDRLLSATNSSEAYTYDVVGNRLTGPNGEKYTYDAANRLIGISGPVNATFTYDADGNLTGQTVNNVTTTYAWNSAGQLVSVTKAGKTANFEYDASGRRIKKIADGKATLFVYDGTEVAFALDATDPEKKPGGYFVHGPGIDNHLAAVFGDTPASGSAYYYHVDGLGSVTAVTNAAGEEIATNRYDSFGKLVAQTGSVPFASPYAYTGREWDSEAGLYYYRARYYDPSLGRFISEDPIGFAGGLNFYAYVGNNPLRWVDPAGLDVTINIDRTTYTTNSIVGTISVTSTVTNSTFGGYALENRAPPANANLPVPSGTYSASVRTDYTPNRVQLDNVPNAVGIQIHNANGPDRVVGCFAAGTTTSPDWVGNSVDAMNSINNIISADGSGNITVIVNGSATGP